MPSHPSRPSRPGRLLALIPLQVALVGGCGDSSATGPATGLVPPSNRIEGMQRIRQANNEHDRNAPANQRSVVNTARRR